MIEVPSTEPLNALLVEDNPGDAALMTARLQLAGGPRCSHNWSDRCVYLWWMSTVSRGTGALPEGVRRRRMA